MSVLPPPPPPSPTAADPAPSRYRTIAERFIDGRCAVSQPAVSPDGARVAFVVSMIDLTENTTRTRLWLDDAPLTGGAHDANPTWSPDGRFLAFTSRRGEKTGDSTLHVLPVGGPGELRTVCTMPDGLGDVTWSPDGRWLAFTSRTRHERYDAKDVSWQSPRKIERFFARLNGEGWIHDRPQHVYVVAADGTGTPRNLTPGEFQHHGTSWLHDSSGVITAAQRHGSWDRDQAVDLYSVSLPVGDDAPTVRCLTAHDGSYASPSVSPDGSMVAFIGVGDPSTYPQNEKIGILPVDSDQAPESEIRWVSSELDRTFSTTVGAPAPVWESNDTLLAIAEDRGATHLYRLRADGSMPPEPVTSGRLAVTAYDAAGTTLATTRATVDRTTELFVGDEERTAVGATLAERLVGWEHFTVPTTDDTDEIDAWIMRPAGLDESIGHPVLLNVHGGPHTQYGESFHDEFQMQAAAGFVVVCCNPRGSSGRDTAWGQAINGPDHPVAPGSGWATADVDDLLAVLDASLDRYAFCDADRVGMLGGSYGGYMATWLAGHHGDRFRAICSERAVNDAISFEWSSDIATAFSAVHGGTHLELADAYRRLSPIGAVHDIDTPMLIIHSEEDWRCPISQAEELWVTLKLLGKDVDFYRFPGENHELSRSGSPVHRVQRAEIILGWFADKLA